MNSPALDELLATEAIRQLKARYCRFFDTKQWDRLAKVFSPDAQLEGFTSVPDGSDPATFINAVSKRMVLAITIHQVYTPEIVFSEPKQARSIWPMMDYVEFQADDQATPAPTDRGWIGWGYYEEEYVCIDGVWLIAFMRLTRQRMDELTPDHPQAKLGRRGPDKHWL